MVADNKKTAEDLDKTLAKTFADQPGTICFSGDGGAAKSRPAAAPMVVVNLDGIPGSARCSRAVVQQIIARGRRQGGVVFERRLGLLSIQPLAERGRVRRQGAALATPTAVKIATRFAHCRLGRGALG
jgi:hypothetical protein